MKELNNTEVIIKGKFKNGNPRIEVKIPKQCKKLYFVDTAFVLHECKFIRRKVRTPISIIDLIYGSKEGFIIDLAIDFQGKLYDLFNREAWGRFSFSKEVAINLALAQNKRDLKELEERLELKKIGIDYLNKTISRFEAGEDSLEEMKRGLKKV